MENTPTPSSSNSESLNAATTTPPSTTTAPENQFIQGTDDAAPPPSTPPPRSGGCRKPQPQPPASTPKAETNLYTGIVGGILGLLAFFLLIMLIVAYVYLRRLRRLVEEDGFKGFDRNKMVKPRECGAVGQPECMCVRIDVEVDTVTDVEETQSGNECASF